MKQENCVRIKNEKGNIELFCESDTALGDLHDFLLLLKGHIVDKMVKAQKEEEEITEKKMEPEKDALTEKVE